MFIWGGAPSLQGSRIDRRQVAANNGSAIVALHRSNRCTPCDKVDRPGCALYSARPRSQTRRSWKSYEPCCRASRARAPSPLPLSLDTSERGEGLTLLGFVPPSPGPRFDRDKSPPTHHGPVLIDPARRTKPVEAGRSASPVAAPAAAGSLTLPLLGAMPQTPGSRIDRGQVGADMAAEQCRSNRLRPSTAEDRRSRKSYESRWRSMDTGLAPFVRLWRPRKPMACWEGGGRTPSSKNSPSPHATVVGERAG